MSDFKKTFVYKTERGDDLDSIAEKFSTTKQIVVTNNLLTSKPEQGDMLVIERANGKEYTVKPFDTIERLSGGDKRREIEILKNNKIDFIYVGQKIYL